MLTKITKKILSQIPENVKYLDAEKELLFKHRDFILSVGDIIVKKFYDSLYSCEATRNIFKEGERPIREKSLAMWLSKTLEPQSGIEYWEWQTFVGILHIKRGVTNNMMATMLNAVSETILEEAIKHLDSDEAISLMKAWMKLSGMISAFIAEGYRLFYLRAIENVTGLSETLLNNTVKVEIDDLIKINNKYRL